MIQSDEYSKLSDEALVAKEKVFKRNETFSAFAIGFLMGVIVYGVAKNGIGFIYIGIPLVLIIGVIKNTKAQKQKRQVIQSEIELRKSKA